MRLSEYFAKWERQALFARRTKMSPQTLSRLAGGRQWPSSRTAAKIFQATGGRVFSWDIRALTGQENEDGDGNG